MSANPPESRPPERSRLRSGLRRHGLAPRPAGVRRTLGRGVRFTEGNAAELYACGREAFPAMLDAIARARDFIHLETYILRGDRIGCRFVEALADRAADGVDVRLLYDALGSYQLDSHALDSIRRAGGEVVCFNPLRRLHPRWAPRRRDHRKILIVDGVRAFTGGLNIGDEYDAESVDCDGAIGWRDTHLEVRGPAVRELGAVFLESWFRAGGPDLPWHALLDVDLDQPGTSRCAVLPDGPVYRRRTMRDLIVASLDAARATARLTTPYFVPDGRVVDALLRAAQRGVRVELVLAGRSDHPLLRRGVLAMLDRVLQHGIVIHEYMAGVLHSKAAVFDGEIGVVGTSNLDRQSFQHSYEVNLVFAGGTVPAQLDRIFEEDRARSRAVTLDGLAQRGPLTRAIDRLIALAVRHFV